MSRTRKAAISILLCLLLTIAAGIAYIPESQACSKPDSSAAGKGNGLTGEYYDKIDFKDLKITRTDNTINFNWGKSSPHPQIASDTFSVRWTGKLEPKYSEKYTFHTYSDDGVKLWIGDHLIINKWKDQSVTEHSGKIQLEAGKKYEIKLEYYENKVDSVIKLFWSSKSQRKEIIPGKYLYSPGITSKAPSPSKLDLTSYFNEDGFSYDSKRRDGDYDGHDYTYSANLVVSEILYENIPYTLGPMKNGTDNSISCDGQTLTLEKKKYSSLRLLGSATNGDKTGVFRINYKDGTHTDLKVTFKDWCTSDISGQKIVQAMQHRHSSTGDQTIKNYIFAYYLSPDAGKEVKSITLPDKKDIHILALSLVPKESSLSRPGSGTGLKGEYFDSKDFTKLKLVRTDKTVNFNWDTGSPDPSVGRDTFSVRWSGFIEPLFDETYTFHTVTDDGVRLWINNKPVIDHWNNQSATEYSGKITLTAGKKYSIKMEYYEEGGDAVAKLLWSSPSQAKTVISVGQLYLAASD